MALTEQFPTAAGYRAWTPAAPSIPAVNDDSYVGKHRRPGGRGFAMFRMFYRARHRRM